jgi:hypothetical protein
MTTSSSSTTKRKFIELTSTCPDVSPSVMTRDEVERRVNAALDALKPGQSVRLTLVAMSQEEFDGMEDVE